MPRTPPMTPEPGPIASPGSDAEIERLRQDVRALRHEIARLEPVPARTAPRGLTIATGIGAAAIGGAILTASVAIDLPTPPGWERIAEQMSAQAAVGIVERIFTVY